MSGRASIALSVVLLMVASASPPAAQPAPAAQQPEARQPQPPLRLPPPLELSPPVRTPTLLQWPPPFDDPQPVPPQAQGEPRQGQAGKDVIWLPTPEALVERMLTMAQVGPRDVVYDLGSGDGRLVIAAARRGAEAVGIEFNPELVAFSEKRAREQGPLPRARFVQGDIFATDFSRASVVTLYLLSTLNLRLRPTLVAMRPGTRVVSHAFDMGDWTPDEVSRTDGRTAYLWIVPAPVDGGWRLELAGGPALDVTLVQLFQGLEGTVTLGPVEASLREPALRGDAIRFGFVDASGAWYELSGTVSGDRMSGSYRAAARKGEWKALRR
jgi:SAM-dependent methyltransferase